MMFLNPYRFGPAALVCDGADFDGTNDYMTRGAGLTGAADSKSGIFSGWIRLDGGNAVNMRVLGNSLGILVSRSVSNEFQVIGRNASATQILLLRTAPSYTASAAWVHVLMSWDLSTVGARHLYIDDVSDLVVQTFTNDTLDYTESNFAVGANPSSISKFDGALAECYFAPGQYLDFSVEENRRKFISAAGKPVNLGSDGSTPTGTAPLVYQHLDDGEAVANFATNRGTGGNFTIAGTLATASTSPSD